MEINGVVLGVFGGAVFLAITLEIRKILQNLEKDRETAMTKFQVKEDTSKAFKSLAVATFLISAILGFKFFLDLVRFEDRLADLVVVPLPLAFLFIAYFFYKIRKVTQPE
ncbi:MAG: hypothetical protein ABEJ93_01570 [Candidatus Nanohalobium sp.]